MVERFEQVERIQDIMIDQGTYESVKSALGVSSEDLDGNLPLQTLVLAIGDIHCRTDAGIDEIVTASGGNVRDVGDLELLANVIGMLNRLRGPHSQVGIRLDSGSGAGGGSSGSNPHVRRNMAHFQDLHNTAVGRGDFDWDHASGDWASGNDWKRPE